MKHLMMDIETLGTKSFCVVVSIGVVEFDPTTGKVGDSRYWNIDVKDSLGYKLQVSGDTLQWWMGQSHEARKGLFTDTYPLKTVLDELRVFCKGKGYKVWGNSARFDLGLVENLYTLFKEDIPWSPWNEMDVRTLANLRPDIKKNYKHEGINHNALSDCYKQIGYISEIWKDLKL